METKKINCDLTADQLRALGEPIAYFSAILPKEVKNLNKCVEDNKGTHPQLQAICLEPSRNKLIASDSRILAVVDAECSGVWPGEKDGSPFQCYIEPKAIRELAGKTVDIAVWEDEGCQKVTVCEASGVQTQTAASFNLKYPNWQRVIMGNNNECSITIKKDEIGSLRKFIQEHRGKTKSEKESRIVEVHATPEADDLLIRIWGESYGIDINSAIATTSVNLEGEYPTHYIREFFSLELFYYAIQEDFNGGITFHRNKFGPEIGMTTFNGTYRVSLMYPKSGIRSYLTTEKP